MIATVLEFGEFTLDRGRFELCRNGQAIALERKPMELLILLAERNGQLVTRAEIVERLWEREVFVDTEHGINTAIRKIRQVLRDDSDEPRFIQTVTGKGYRFVATVRGLDAETLPTGNHHAPPSAQPPRIPPTSPSQNLTPEAPSQSLAPRGALSVFWVAIPATLALAIGIFYGARFLIHRHLLAAANIRSLAVLPLDNLSGDPNQDYFADGMTDELTTMLAKDSTLRIVSRTSVLQYKRAHRPLPEIARALNVDGIVEGSVARTGNQVHMNLQLIRADTDSHLWADSYDRDVNDTALPDEAAQAIAKRLHSSTPVATTARYINPAAHDAFLRGRYLWFTDRMDLSGDYFRKATQIQPDYADAWAWLSCYYGEGIAGSLLDPRANLQPQWDTAQRAMQLDPDLPDAHWAMGAAFFFVRWDWANADREFQRAISMDPRNAEYYYVRANLLEALNRFDEAIAIEKKAMELDPFERPDALASLYPGARQYDAALAEIRLRMQASPNNPAWLFLEWDTYRRIGNYKESMEAWAKWHIATGDPKSAAELRRAYELGGAKGFVRWELNRRLMQSKTQFVSPGELALLYAQLGDRNKTLDLLEEAYRWHTIDVAFIQTDSAFDFLHSDPRYRALVQKIGLPPAY